MEKILADLPTPPGSSHKHVPSVPQAISPKKSPRKLPHKSPRKSPAKVVPASKGNSGRKSRHLSRTSFALPSNIISYETELIPPHIPTFEPYAPSKSSLLPSSFVLPPPSPRASLPNQPALPPAQLDLADNKSSDISSSLPPIVDIYPPPDEEPIHNSDENIKTPIAPLRPFPVAKPFAQRMFHAYSPAKPSPLSRILMLADSPVTPPNGLLQADISQSPTSLPSEGDSENSLERAILGIPAVPMPKPATFLAPELGFDVAAKDASPVQSVLSNLDSKKHANMAESNVRSRTSAMSEKENRNSNKQRVFSKPRSAGAAGGSDVTRKVSPTTSGAKAPMKSVKGTVPVNTNPVATKEKSISKPSISKSGPRRVPVNSADAPSGKAWKS